MPQVWELALVSNTPAESGEMIPHLLAIELHLKEGWEPFAVTPEGMYFRKSSHLSPELDVMAFGGLEEGAGWEFYVGPKNPPEFSDEALEQRDKEYME